MKISADESKKIKDLKEIIDKQERELSRLTTLENMQNAILDLVAGIHWWKNKEGIYCGCNQAMVEELGLNSKEDIIGKTDYELPWSEQADMLVANDNEVMSIGKIQKGKEELVGTKDGDIHTFMVAKAPIYNIHGEIIGTVGNSIDITERKKMEEALEKAKLASEMANEAKTEFIANMSHDIRTPLTGILGLIEELVKVADDTLSSLQQVSFTDSTKAREKYLLLINQLIEKVRKEGQLILEASDELLQLLNEILETMRLESGKVAEKEESFNLRQLLKHNIDLMLPVARHKQLELSCEMPEYIPTYVSGLYNYLDRSLLNLLSNALKFTEKGFVKLKVQLLGKKRNYHVGDKIKLKISIQDSGIGIPKDKFETIFEHFSRLTSSYQGLYKGAGLGLYTVKHYVESMQATIEVESEVGKGTSFIITLPLTVSDHSDHEKISFRTLKPSLPFQKIRSTPLKVNELAKTNASVSILIVEDNSLAARAVQYNLNRVSSNCRSDIAVNGFQAIKMVQEHDYDLILMDIGLPDIEGIEVTRRIRALNNPKFSQIPIIAITGHANNSKKREEALAATMQEVYTKPLPYSELESLLKRYVFKTGQEPFGKQAQSPGIETQETRKVIDWAKCLQQCGGDEDYLRELLSALAADLKISQERIIKTFEARDDEALRNELHRVYGGVVYLTLPQLSEALAKFHQTVKEKPENPEQLQKTYAHFLQAMDLFLETLKSLDIACQ